MKGDPCWLTARFDGKCRGCNKPIQRGERAFYYPRTKAIYGSVSCTCGEKHATEFHSAAQDEELMP